LQLLVEQRRKLVNGKTRLLNRLTSTLKGYFPQVLTWFQPLDTQLVYAFLQRWPALEAVQQTDDSTLLQFFLRHHSKRQSLNQRRTVAMRQAIPATTDEAVMTVSVMIVQALLEQIRCSEAIRGFDRQIDALTRSHADFEILASLPGTGRVHASRLISALGTDRSRYDRVEDLLTFAGIAPVVERSGRAMLTHVRWFCPTFLRQSSMNLPGNPFGTVSGRKRTTGSSGPVGSRVKLRSELWPSSEPGSSSGAGRVIHLMTSGSIWQRWRSVDRHS
jgi:hypothetical protein